jgi:hypothetical protein
MECRERAVECRQMAERAPMQAALIDMAKTWERLAHQNAWLNCLVTADQMAFSFTELRENEAAMAAFAKRSYPGSTPASAVLEA